MSCFSMPPPSSTAISTVISAVHPDIIRAHVLTRLDGPTLASAACTSSELHSIASHESLWINICHSTWPSTSMPRVQQVISTFPSGHRSFFSDAFSLRANSNPEPLDPNCPSELISAVDIYYRKELIFSKIVENETESAWFRCSPFRVDLIDPKDTVPTRIPNPEIEDTCHHLAEDLTLSWILIDPIGRRAMNLSSQMPVSVQRHWLSGEVQVRFASILSGDNGTPAEFVQCGILVTCAGSHGGDMHVREVSLQVEDMDGMHLNGKDSLVILQRTMEGKRGRNGRREEEGGRSYEKYLERKRERRERKLRTEGALDMLCVAFGVLAFGSLGLIVFCR